MTDSPTKTDSMRFRCPHCEVILRGKREDGGKERRCPKCEKSFRIPQAKSKLKSAAPKAGTAAPKKKKKQDELIPVVCGVCQTRMYANTAQIGSSIECPDCFTQNLVKPPPKEAKKSAPRMGVEMSYDIEPERPVEIIGERAQALLDKADKEIVEELEAAPDRPEKPFITGVYTYPFWLQTFPILIGMTFSWTLLLVAIRFALLFPFMIPVAAVLTVTVALPSLVTFQRICVNTSNMDDDSDCRPEGGFLGIIDWVFESIPIGFAIFMAGLPAALVITTFRPGYVWYALLPFSLYLFFPIVYMSMLENASAAGIYSGPVWGSLSKLPGTWMKFYVSTGLLIGLLFASTMGAIYWRLQLQFPPAISTAIGVAMGLVALSTIVITLYFRLLGRVGMVFAEKITIEDKETPAAEEPDGFLNAVD